jgi:hypothetical protein
LQKTIFVTSEQGLKDLNDKQFKFVEDLVEQKDQQNKAATEELLKNYRELVTYQYWLFCIVFSLFLVTVFLQVLNWKRKAKSAIVQTPPLTQSLVAPSVSPPAPAPSRYISIELGKCFFDHFVNIFLDLSVQEITIEELKTELKNNYNIEICASNEELPLFWFQRFNTRVNTQEIELLTKAKLLQNGNTTVTREILLF